MLEDRGRSGDPAAPRQAFLHAIRRFHELAEALPPFDALQAASEARYELEERARDL